MMNLPNHKYFKVIKTDRGFEVVPDQPSKRYRSKLIIPNRFSRYGNSEKDLEHIFTIEKVVKDTNEYEKSKGVLFVDLAHDGSTCDLCKKHNEFINTRNECIENYSSKINIYRKHLKLLDKLIINLRYEKKYYIDNFGPKKYKQYDEFKFKPNKPFNDIDLPKYLDIYDVNIGDIGWKLNYSYDNNYYLQAYVCTKYNKEKSFVGYSEDEMRKEYRYELVPAWELIYPQPEVPKKYKEEYKKVLANHEYMIKYNKMIKKYIDMVEYFYNIFYFSSKGDYVNNLIQKIARLIIEKDRVLNIVYKYDYFVDEENYKKALDVIYNY